MKARVITLIHNKRSVQVANRCIESAARFGVEVDIFPAIRAADNPKALMFERKFSMKGFEDNEYSRLEPCLATFLSHSRLWELAVLLKEAVLILEHDAVFQAPLPEMIEERVKMLCNLGKPSFGSFKTPKEGLGPFVSKPGGYLGGAHAYLVQPEAAEVMLEKAKTEAEPADVFIQKKRFPWMTEYYPWPVICDDSFSTIQKPAGCTAKHNKVEIIDQDES